MLPFLATGALHRTEAKMPPLLQLSRISKSFGAVRALNEVSFSLEPGEVHALLGENGAGKSTLIKVITGAHAPDDGRIELDGHPVEALSPARARALGIGCIYQQPALVPDLTVAENIALRLESASPARRVRWAARHAQAKELLHKLGAEIDPAAEVRQLSMPDQQLVEIACALGSGARIVIMDEPTASLTQKEQHLLFAVVRGLRAHGAGVIPKRIRASSVRPAPTSPASPTISPARTSRFTPCTPLSRHPSSRRLRTVSRGALSEGG